MQEESTPKPASGWESIIQTARAVVATALVVGGGIFGLQYHGYIPAGMTAPVQVHPTDEEWAELEALAMSQTRDELAAMDQAKAAKLSLQAKHRMCTNRLIRLTAEWCLKQ